MSLLFTSFRQRELTLRNRIVMSPMCQYSAEDGIPNAWHYTHLVSRAVGGAAVVMTEAAAVSAQGRISPRDVGLWNDEQLHAWAGIIREIKANGAIAAMQLAHAGRKASTAVPWEGHHAVDPQHGGWTVVAPSAIAYSENYLQPVALDQAGITQIVTDFENAAKRALEAGIEIVEIHAAHGYLLHQFLSPLSNQREDDYGGNLSNRMRLVLECTRAVRAVWPQHLPVWVRISATDWVEGGWDLSQSITLAKELRALDVDLIDVSSGGLSPLQKITIAPGYQVPFAADIRRQADIATGAVGLLTQAEQCEHVLQRGCADVVLVGRELLRNPYFPQEAENILDQSSQLVPKQYLRAWN